MRRQLRATRRERRRGTRERIIAALLQLLEQRDLGFVTIDVIARAAGVSHATFYRYFDDKNAALTAVVSSVAGEMLTPVFSLDEPISSVEGERERVARWVHHLAAVFVRHSSLVETGEPDLLATGILSIAHGIMKRLVYDRQERLIETLVASGIETMCRAIFGSEEPRTSGLET
jgi:AcrR family transcriptional regulator